MFWGYLRSAHALILEELNDMQSLCAFWQRTRNGWQYNAHQISMIHRGVFCRMAAVDKEWMKRLTSLDRSVPPMWLQALHCMDCDEDGLSCMRRTAETFSGLCNEYGMHACIILVLRKFTPSQRTAYFLLQMFEKLVSTVGVPKILVHLYMPIRQFETDQEVLRFATDVISERPEAGLLPVANYGLCYASQVAAIIDELPKGDRRRPPLGGKPWNVLSLLRQEMDIGGRSTRELAVPASVRVDLEPRLVSGDVIYQYLELCDAQVLANMIALGRVILARETRFVLEADYDYATDSVECQDLP